MNWNDILADFEKEFASARKEKMHAAKMLREVGLYLAQAERTDAGADVIDRLDLMNMALTQAAKENVCSNTKCPHYNKKCKMR